MLSVWTRVNKNQLRTIHVHLTSPLGLHVSTGERITSEDYRKSQFVSPNTDVVPWWNSQIDTWSIVLRTGMPMHCYSVCDIKPNVTNTHAHVDFSSDLTWIPQNFRSTRSSLDWVVRQALLHTQPPEFIISVFVTIKNESPYSDFGCYFATICSKRKMRKRNNEGPPTK